LYEQSQPFVGSAEHGAAPLSPSVPGAQQAIVLKFGIEL
jgi:hypothetical protein